MARLFTSEGYDVQCAWLTGTILTGTQGLIFVIDSNDRSRIDEAQKELHRIILDREMGEALLLVFANKQDIHGGENWLQSRAKGEVLTACVKQ